MQTITGGSMFGWKTVEDQFAWVIALSQRIRATGGEAIDPKLIQSPTNVATDVVPLRARLDAGRWIADCANPECSAASMIEPGQASMCPICGNADVGHRWRLVEVPSNKAEIDAVMAPRKALNQFFDPDSESLKEERLLNRVHHLLEKA